MTNSRVALERVLQVQPHSMRKWMAHEAETIVQIATTWASLAEHAKQLIGSLRLGCIQWVYLLKK